MTTPDITATRRDARTRSGLYGSGIGRNMAADAVAETLGTFILIYGGTAVAVAASLARDARLSVPVGTCEQHGPHLPLGCDTLIVERLADDLSAEFAVVRAPTLEYGVNVVTERHFAGNASLRKKTLHRVLNDLLDT